GRIAERASGERPERCASTRSAALGARPRPREGGRGRGSDSGSGLTAGDERLADLPELRRPLRDLGHQRARLEAGRGERRAVLAQHRDQRLEGGAALLAERTQPLLAERRELALEL